MKFNSFLISLCLISIHSVLGQSNLNGESLNSKNMNNLGDNSSQIKNAELLQKYQNLHSESQLEYMENFGTNSGAKENYPLIYDKNMSSRNNNYNNPVGYSGQRPSQPGYLKYLEYPKEKHYMEDFEKVDDKKPFILSNLTPGSKNDKSEEEELPQRPPQKRMISIETERINQYPLDGNNNIQNNFNFLDNEGNQIRDQNIEWRQVQRQN